MDVDLMGSGMLCFAFMKILLHPFISWRKLKYGRWNDCVKREVGCAEWVKQGEMPLSEENTEGGTMESALDSAAGKYSERSEGGSSF